MHTYIKLNVMLRNFVHRNVTTTFSNDLYVGFLLVIFVILVLFVIVVELIGF